MQQRAADNISPESVAQRARMTEIVPQLRKVTTLKDSMTVKLPWGVDVNAVPGRDNSVLNFLNERYAPFGADPSRVLYVLVRKTFLQGTGGDPPLEVRVVSSCTLTFTFEGDVEVDVDFLTFCEEGTTCVDMILNVAPYGEALDAKAAAATVSANSEAGPGSAGAPAGARAPAISPGKSKPKGAGKGRMGSRKGAGAGARASNPVFSEPLPPQPIEAALRAPAAVAVGRVQDNALHSCQAVSVCLHNGTDAHDLTTKFWMEEVWIPRSHAWTSESRTVRCSFSSPSAAWHTVHMLTCNQGSHPSLELESDLGAARRCPFREIWSVFFMSNFQHATSLSFAAIMCPSQHVTRATRETSGLHSLSTLAEPDECFPLPRGYVIQNVGNDDFEGSTPMLVVLIPPFATRDVDLVSPKNVTSPMDTCWRHRRESRVALEDFAKVRWQTEFGSHRTVTYELPSGYGDGPDWLAILAQNPVASRREPYPGEPWLSAPA